MGGNSENLPENLENSTNLENIRENHKNKETKHFLDYEGYVLNNREGDFLFF